MKDPDLEKKLKELRNKTGLNTDLNVDTLKNTDDFKNYGKLPIFDYDKELQDSELSARLDITALAQVYIDKAIFDDIPYIQRKIQSDAKVLAKLHFLELNSFRTLKLISADIENGNIEPRVFESLSLLQKEMRETIKLRSKFLEETEKSYKQLYQDIQEQTETEFSTESNVPITESAYSSTPSVSTEQLSVIDLNKMSNTDLIKQLQDLKKQRE